MTKKEVDLTDDWMNPPLKRYHVPPYKPFKIERERAISCSFYGPRPTEWVIYAEFNTPEERDKYLEFLKNNHPMWHLRSVDFNVVKD